MTIREIIANANIDSLDAYLLLGNILTRRHHDYLLRSSQAGGGAADFNKSKLLAMSEEQIDDETIKEFNSLVERRKNGECVAYITGKKEFWNLEFFVNKAVLVPRPETEILVETAINFLTANRANCTKTTKKVLDLCTGSGVIAIAIKHEMPELEVYATDISPEALEVAETNAKRLLSNNNNITFLQGDLYNALPSSLLTANCSLFTLIVSNPPYIATSEIQTLSAEVRNEPLLALDGGKTGLEIIERIIKDAPKHLEQGGHLLLETDPRQIEQIKLLFANNGFKDIIIYKDLAGLNRVIGGKT